MTADNTMLQIAALATAQTMPRVVSEMAKAAHGVAGARLKHLNKAQAHLRELLERLELTEAQVKRAMQDEEAKAS